MDATPLERECVVSGTLYFVLQISRLAGTSPVTFERVNGGWRIRVSLIYHIYCCVVQVVLAVGIGIFVIDRDNIVDGYEASNNTGFMRIIMIIYLMVHMMSGAAIAFTGLDRMRHMIDCKARLQWINGEIDRLLLPSKSNERTMLLLFIAILVFGYYAMSFEYGVYISDLLNAHVTVTYHSCAYVAVYLSLIHIHTYSTQFWLVIMQLVSTQKRLNDCLKSILEELKNDQRQSFKFEHVNEETKSNEGNPVPNHVISWAIDSLPVIVRRRTNNGLTTDPATLDRLIEVYCSICGIIRQLNDSNGFALLMMLLFIFVELLTAPYFAVAIIFRMHTATPVAKILSWLMWCLLCIVTLAMTVDACHRSHIQLWMTRRLIRHMRRHTPREAAQVSDKLKMFYRHIQLNPVRFAPLKLILFNRNILIMVWSGVVTYLSVVMNL